MRIIGVNYFVACPAKCGFMSYFAGVVFYRIILLGQEFFFVAYFILAGDYWINQLMGFRVVCK
jgi:hypothetical protein